LVADPVADLVGDPVADPVGDLADLLAVLLADDIFVRFRVVYTHSARCELNKSQGVGYILR